MGGGGSFPWNGSNWLKRMRIFRLYGYCRIVFQRNKVSSTLGQSPQLPLCHQYWLLWSSIHNATGWLFNGRSNPAILSSSGTLDAISTIYQSKKGPYLEGLLPPLPISPPTILLLYLGLFLPDTSCSSLSSLLYSYLFQSFNIHVCIFSIWTILRT